jgi:hypothetical protein
MLDTTVIMIVIAVLLIGVILFGSLTGGQNNKVKNALLRELSELLNSAKRISSQSESRDLIIKADNILSRALQRKFSNEESVGSNLKKADYLYKKSLYNKIWHYHKLRNKVVHEDLTPEKEEVEKALNIFYKAVDKLL